jgi:hypothetical protein
VLVPSADFPSVDNPAQESQVLQGRRRVEQAAADEEIDWDIPWYAIMCGCSSAKGQLLIAPAPF